jgi:hypothetical protein
MRLLRSLLAVLVSVASGFAGMESVSCRHEQGCKTMENQVHVAQGRFGLPDEVSVSVFARLPWGREGGIGEIFSPEPLTDVLVEGAPRKARGSVETRVMPDGKIALLTLDNALLVLDARGQREEEIAIPALGESLRDWRILDFVLDHRGNVYLLERWDADRSVFTAIRKIGRGGAPEWRVARELDSKKHASGDGPVDLMSDGRDIFLGVRESGGFSVFLLDRQTGSLSLSHKFAEICDRVFVDHAGRWYCAQEVWAEGGKRYWVQYDLRSDREIGRWEIASMSEMPGMPVAADNAGRGYEAFGFAMACIAPGGSLAWRARIDNIVFDAATGRVLVSTLGRDETSPVVLVSVFAADGRPMPTATLRIPMGIAQGSRIANWRLLYIDSSTLYVSGSDPACFDAQEGRYRYQEFLLAYSARDGSVLRIDDKPAETLKVRFALQGAATWQVDGDGRVFFPVLGPDAFYLFTAEFCRGSANGC